MKMDILESLRSETSKTADEKKKITCLITSGGTKIKIDMVRHLGLEDTDNMYIGNMSKGTFGAKIADKALNAGLNVIFLYAKDSKMPTVLAGKGQMIKFVQYETFDDYADRLKEQLALQPDIIILAAAVSDYGVDNYVNGKIRSSEDLVIKLKPLPKLIGMVREACPKSVLCGFKLLVNSNTEDLEQAVTNSINKNKCDLVVGNDLRDIKNSEHILTIGEACKGEEYDYGTVFLKSFSVNKYVLEKIVIDHCLDHYLYKNRKIDVK